jgi:hypothetical protein
MRIGLVTSAIGHGAVLLWSIVSFAARPYDVAPVDSLPVDIISSSEFSQLTKGVKTAEKVTTPKPFAEKIADQTPPKEEPAPKVVEKKQEIVSAAEPPPPPKQAEPKPAPPAKAEPDPALEALEALKKNEPKKTEPKPEPPKQAEAPTPVKKPPPPKPQPKFDPTKVAALLDKRDPRRQSITGQEIHTEQSLGSPLGSAATLSQNEIDALRAQIQRCWNPPIGLADAKSLIIALKVNFNQNGSLQRDPVLLNRDANPMFQIAAESAIRAILQCQPYKLPIARYDVWKEVEFAFDPRDMFR